MTVFTYTHIFVCVCLYLFVCLFVCVNSMEIRLYLRSTMQGPIDSHSARLARHELTAHTRISCAKSGTVPHACNRLSKGQFSLLMHSTDFPDIANIAITLRARVIKQFMLFNHLKSEEALFSRTVEGADEFVMPNGRQTQEECK